MSGTSLQGFHSDCDWRVGEEAIYLHSKLLRKLQARIVHAGALIVLDEYSAFPVPGTPRQRDYCAVGVSGVGFLIHNTL